MNNNLREIRKKLKLTQAQLAQMIGCSTGNISQYENNGQRIRQEVAMRIISAAKFRGLAITFEDIYGKTNMDEIKIVREEKPNVQVMSDAFGGSHILINGRVFITINYIAPWIDNMGMRSLTNDIVSLVKGENGPSCAREVA